MSKLKYAVPALAFLALAGTASAQTQKGYITAFDPQSRLVTLDNGSQYRLAPIVDETNLSVGEWAYVIYDVDGKTNNATSVLAGHYPINDAPQSTPSW
jgi:hypothetical protein